MLQGPDRYWGEEGDSSRVPAWATDEAAWQPVL